MSAATATAPPTAVEFDAAGPLPTGRALLEASAGTGKTHTITSLVLRLVAEERIGIDQLLVVTFTRAATAELRDRVRGRLAAADAALEQALHRRSPSAAGGGAPADEEGPAAGGDEGSPTGGRDAVIDALVTGAGSRDELAARRRAIAAARAELDEATIATIHGFCQQALAHAGLTAGVDLDASLTDDITELLEEVVDDYLVRELRGSDPQRYALIASQHTGRDELLGIARQVEAEPELRLLPDVDPDEDLEAAWQRIVADCRQRWLAGRDEARAWLAAHGEAGGFSGRKYTRDLDRYLAKIDACCQGEPPPLGDLGDVKALEYLDPKVMRRNLESDVALAEPPDAVLAIRELLACGWLPGTLVRARFAAHARDEIARRKRERGVLSFSDLLRRLRDALDDPESRGRLVATLRQRYRAALIDEFQDTDPVQWDVFRQLFPPGQRLLLIGDPKQAIYGFRGADIRTYRDAADTVERTYTLTTSYRSDQRYLDALNALFDHPEPFGDPDIAHRPVRAAAAGQTDRLRLGQQPASRLRLRLVPRPLAERQAGVNAQGITKEWARQRLPRLVARDVAELLADDAELVVGDGATRGLQPADIAVLTRTNDQARRVQRALADAGVPAVTGTDQSVFATQEAVQLQRLLDALAGRGGERELRAALATPLLGADAHELLDLDERGWDHWMDLLSRWSRLWRSDGVAAMIRAAQADTDAPRRLVARPGGERTLTNVRHLTELLHAAEHDARRGPTALAGWLREQRHLERPEVTDLELRLESDAAAVQILTVHRAKGLQYPVVLSPFLWEGRLLGDPEKRTLRFHAPEHERRALDVDLAYGTGIKARHVATAHREQWEESLRLAYVALTRAAHHAVVYTGAFFGAGVSPLAHLLHGRSVPRPDEDAQLVQHLADLDDDRLRSDLQALPGEAVAVDDVAPLDGPVPVWTRPTTPGVELAARTLDRGLDRAWQRTSFSRLVRDEAELEPGSPDAEGRDHDQRAEADLQAVPDDADPTVPDAGAATAAGASPPQAAGRAEAQVPLAGFPRGADAGTFLHHVLEHLDFPDAGDDAVLRPLLDEWQRRAGLTGIDQDALAEGLRAALATPLGPQAGEQPLAGLARADRLDELDFDLPLAGGHAAGDRAVTLDAIGELLADHADGDEALSRTAARLRARPTRPARGFLTGSIDLVCRLDGRFLVVDYKSNWLGRPAADGLGERCTVDDYAPDRLVEAMVEHDYLLQGLLYLVALHRYLRWRLPGYDYDRDVGGLAYLFLRGMVGPEAPRGPDGAPHGVFARRPPRALVEDLDTLLSRGAATAPPAGRRAP